MRETYQNGVLRARWDTTTRIYQAWNASGVKTEERPFTAAEAAEADAAAPGIAAENNGNTLRQRAIDTMQANRDYLALTSPTNAQNLAQIRALTRQNQALIRLVVQRLEGLD